MPGLDVTKKRIFHAAVDCFSDKYYRHCTMQELADRAGVRPASIYQYYPSKEAILRDIFEYFGLNFNKYRIPAEAVIEAASVKPFNEVFPMMFYDFGSDPEKNVMMKITKIVKDMKFENETAAAMFRMVLMDEPAAYLHTIFKTMIARKYIKSFDYKTMTFQMVAFTNMLLVMSLMDQSNHRKELGKIMKNGITMMCRGMVNSGIVKS